MWDEGGFTLKLGNDPSVLGDMQEVLGPAFL
jgi:hypothetical protein